MQTVYNSILVDDERPVRVFTRHILEQFPHVFNIIAEAGSGPEAIEKIEQLRPDVIFLDIQMPGMTGFQLLEKLQHKPIVVFLTAYDQYALKAFDENGIDYLLKPLQEERLTKTIEKINHYYSNKQSSLPDYEKIQALLQLSIQHAPGNRMITVKQGNKILLLSLEDVVAFQSKEKYTAIKTIDGKEYLDTKPLGEFEKELPVSFLRVQKGAIVNTKQVLEIKKHFNNRFVFYLKDKQRTEILTGHTYVNMIRERLGI